MSSGRPVEDNRTKTKAQLYTILGKGDTGILKAQPFMLDVEHDIPNGGGISVDRKIVFVDRTLYRMIMSGEIVVEDMTPDQVVFCICEHEHTEKCVADGDNPVDNYSGAHCYGNTGENRAVEATRASPDKYNAALEPGLARCERMEPEKVPINLWCAPNLDNPNANDERLIKAYQALGVIDAFKLSKATVRYGVGENECKDCRYFHLSDDPMQLGVLGLCDKVCGLMRWDRNCDLWEERADDADADQDRALLDVAMRMTLAERR